MAIETDYYSVGERQADCKHIGDVINFKNQHLVWTPLLGSLKDKSPRHKHWLSSDSREAICEGQTAQQDVAGLLQRRFLDDSDNDGQVTEECKNGTGYIDSSKENAVDVSGRVVP